MELLIVRHAIACERDARRWPDDGARPLSSRGVMRARRAAAGLKKLALHPVRQPGGVIGYRFSLLCKCKVRIAGFIGRQHQGVAG